MTASSTGTRELTSWRFFALVVGPLFFLYLATANWSTPYVVDGFSNVLTAWEVATEGDVYLEDYEVLVTDASPHTGAGMVPARDSAVSKYPPGAAFLTVPLYRLLPGEESVESFEWAGGTSPDVQLPVPPLFPAAIVSSAVAAITVGLLGLTLRRVAPGQMALAGAYTAGLGTGIWSVAADSLWQHGPAMMWIAAGTLLSLQRRVNSGLTFGAAILTRPHTAFIPACNGLWQAWRERTVRPLVVIGLTSMAGLAALIAFNNHVFGTPSVTGGYGDSFDARTSSLDVLEYVGNIALALVHPVRGLLVYSPFLVMLIPGIPAAWRAAPAWVRGSAVGGLLYLLLQLKANRYSGGAGFWGYRYPLESLAASASLWMLAYTEWLRDRSLVVQRLFVYTVVASVVLTAVGALYFSNFWAGPTG
jgi:alpha-1,2-mannosyltransferase